MELTYALDFGLALLPAVLMLLVAGWGRLVRVPVARAWAGFNAMAVVALCLAVLALIVQLVLEPLPLMTLARGPAAGWLAPGLFGAWVSVLVQLLGVAIGIYSSRHLQGEPRQHVYIAALAVVLGAVHVLLLADHWVVLILAWMVIQLAMHRLLCFYPERPFALLAAHKKRAADRAADVLLVVAAALAWKQVGSGSLSDLWAYLGVGQGTALLDWSAVCLVLAVIARTALMPVHGWLVQVMEAPTPVSALLHAGVVNLGGYVLVLFAPLVGTAPVARWLLVVFGLLSAIVAGMVLLTRVSQKVHLAWSTIAQMGFMLLECGLGLYLFAALHLLGHSLYKAHNFLNASSAVRDCQRKILTGEVKNSTLSMVLAVPVALAVVAAIQSFMGVHVWPWWWSAILALAWAPLLWVPKRRSTHASAVPARILAAVAMAVFLTLAAGVVDRAPVGADVDPFQAGGLVGLAGMAAMYLAMVTFQVRPGAIVAIRRWVYAGFYMDEGYTHWLLRLWPVCWAPVDEPAERREVIARAASCRTRES